MESCAERSSLWQRVMSASALIDDLQKSTRYPDGVQLAAARRLAREALREFETHCREHGCREVRAKPSAPRMT